MEHPKPVPSSLNSSPTTFHSTQSTKQSNSALLQYTNEIQPNPLAHKSSPVPVASRQGRSTSANEHLNTTTTQLPTQTRSEPFKIHPSNLTHPFKCAQCDNMYQSKGALNNHQRIKHSSQNTLHSGSSVASTFTNEHFDTTATSTFTQNNHTIHRWRCDRCNGQYRCRKMLREHQRTTCQFFLESNESISVLENDQQQQHDSPVVVNQTFKCIQCPSVFTRNDSLSRHKRRMHHEIRKHQQDSPMVTKTYKCIHCPSVFTKDYSLSKHKRKMHPEFCKRRPDLSMVTKPFKCIHCPKVYLRKDSLRMHITRKHSGIHDQKEKPVHESINEIQENDDRQEDYSLDTHLIVFRKKKRKVGISFTRMRRKPRKKKKNDSNNRTSKQFVCDICGKTMMYERSVERHKQNVHKVTENEVEQDNDDSNEINCQDEINVQHEIDSPHEIDAQDEESNQSSNSVQEMNSESSQSSNIPPYEPVIDQQTRQIVFELIQVEQFIKHLLSRDANTEFTSLTLEDMLKEYDKFTPLITLLGSQGYDRLAHEWMQRKCSLWDEIDHFKKQSLQSDLEQKRKLIMKLIERNGNKEMVGEAIEDLKVTLDRVYDRLHSQRWKSILLDIRNLYSRFYVEHPNKCSIFNSNLTRTRKVKELLPEALKARLDQLPFLSSSNDIDNIKLDQLIELLLDVHSHLKSAQALDRLTDEQLQLVQSVVRTKLPLKMSNIFQNDHLSQCNLVPGHACITLRVLCCFCVNWKASEM